MTFYDFLCMTVAAAWWLGNIRLSAITTFSLRPAANTMASATSSGVSGSQPLQSVSIVAMKSGFFSQGADSRVDGVGGLLVAVKSDDGKLSLDLAGVNANNSHSLGDQLLP